MLGLKFTFILAGLSTGMIDVKAYVCVRESKDDNAPISNQQVICDWLNLIVTVL